MATWGTKNKGKRKVANESIIDNELEKEEIKKAVAEYRKMKREKKYESPPQEEKPKPKRLEADLTKPFSEGEEKLLYMIIAGCCDDYRNAYIKGDERELMSCSKFLQSGRVELYTQGNYEGQGLIDAMNKDLMQKYGAFKKGHKLKRKK